MRIINLEEVCQQVVVLTKNTGRYILSELENRVKIDVETKGLHNFVTHVDKESESRLIRGLSEIIPGSGFIAEEGTSTVKGSEYNWIIDPLDGTTNYIHGLPPFSISVGLMQFGEIVLGVIYEIGLNECFYAWEGGGAFMNGKGINVSKAEKVNDSLIATGFPYHNYKYLDQYMNTMRYFMEHSHGLRRLGSAAADLAYVACGRFEAFYEYGLHPWDVAAGACIVRQAGGRVSDFQGGENFLSGGEIIATNSYIFEEFQSVVSRLMLK